MFFRERIDAAARLWNNAMRLFGRIEIMKRNVLFVAIFLFLALAPSGSAGTKEELVRLQSDVLALTNQIRVMEKSFSEQTQGLKSLVVQLNDQVGQSFLLIQKLSAELQAQSSGDKNSATAVLDEVRALTRKIDDNTTQVSALAQQLAEMKVQAKPITQRAYQGAGTNPESLAFSAETIYHEAYNDLIQGNFDLAMEGFRAFLKNFPSSEKADDAQYNIGEAYYSLRNFPDAITAFSAVINTYPAGDKIASAYFKRAKAELLVGENENAISDFKTVAQKYASAPEAGLAAAELVQLGVELSKTAKPAPARRKP
jgi:tol-pal system protein YbgF